MGNNGVDAVLVSFSEARIMRSKRGRYDVDFNFQLLMIEKHIILSGYLHKDANDSDALSKIYDELKDDIAIFIDLIKKYGYYKENLSNNFLFKNNKK